MKDAEEKKGFFTMWKKRDNLYLQINKDQLEKPFLYIVSYSRGIGSNYLLGGLPPDDRMLQFERHGDRVLLVDVNMRFSAKAGTPIDNARDLSIGNSVVQSFKIESEHDSTKAVLIDLGGLLVSDVTDLAEQMRGAFGGVSARFDKERSALAKVKKFPDNTEIEALLTYTPNDRSRLSIETVPDNRYIPDHRALLVHAPAREADGGALADNRVGYFLDARKDFGREDKENFWVRKINRWRLEKKDPTAAVSEVVKPIVYYIDWTVPDKFRPWVKEGVEKWQKAFEAAGFRNAIVAMDAPAESTGWDPEDVRSARSAGSPRTSRRSAPSDRRAWTRARARSSTRTSCSKRRCSRTTRTPTAATSGPRRSASPCCRRTRFRSAAENATPEMLCMAGDALADGGAMQHLAMLMDQTLPRARRCPTEYLKPAVIWAVMRGRSHAGPAPQLPLSSTPVDKLHDTAWTGANGLYGSVMEYLTPNIDHSRAHQGEYWTTGACTTCGRSATATRRRAPRRSRKTTRRGTRWPTSRCCPGTSTRRTTTRIRPTRRIRARTSTTSAATR
ncbi:MAG: DUF5117 domain-containing protein [Candidatus Eisenbacteria bacterium]|nr:DUF5117 domain-containing protein [Candidatus Eisenbacteria bacterium]